MAEIRIAPVTTGADLRAFIRFPFKLYAGDPYWVPPLIMDQKKTLKRSYPFFEHGDGQLFLAVRGGEVVGRIGAATNSLHDEKYGDRRAFFGWFECAGDQAVANSLFDAAAAWLRDRRTAAGDAFTHMRGPFQWCVNGESTGLLIEDLQPGPPVVLMSYNPPGYPAMFEAAGLAKAMDVYAWRVTDDTRSDDKLNVLLKAVRRRVPNLESRPIDRKAGYQGDMETVRLLFNDAWADNWASLPLTQAEMRVIAAGLRPVTIPQLARIGFVDGKPAGCIVCVPDINQILPALKGRLLPLGWLKLLTGIKRIKSIRTMLMGVAKEFRGKGVELLMISEIFTEGRKLGIRASELSWVLETNAQMNSIAEKVDGVRYRTYRIYERAL